MLKIKETCYAVIFCLALYSSLVFASLQSSLDSMFMSNVTAPGAYNSQSRGGFVGGGVSVRAPISNINLVAFDPPRLSAGCGGIDMYGGSFTFINSAQLAALFRQIAANAAGALFKMAIDSISPEIGKTMEDFQSKMQSLNNMLKNTCAIGTTIAHDLTDPVARNQDLQNLATQATTAVGSVTEAESNVHTASITRQEIAQNAVSHSLKQDDSNKWAESLGRKVSQGSSNESRAIVSSGAGLIKSGVIGESETNKFSGAFAAGLPGGLKGIGASLSTAFGVEKAEKIMSELNRSSKNDNSNALSLARDSTQAFSKDFAETLSKSMQVTDGRTFSNANADLSQAQHQLTSASDRGNSSSVSWSGKSRDLGSLLLQKSGGGATLEHAQNLVSSMMRKLTPNQVAAFNATMETKQYTGKLQRQFDTGHAATDATAKVAYGLEALGEINQDAMYQLAKDYGLVTSSDVGDGGVTVLNKNLVSTGAATAASANTATSAASSLDGSRLQQNVSANVHNVNRGAVDGQVSAAQKEIRSAQGLVRLLGSQLTPPMPGQPTSPAVLYQQQVEAAAKEAGILNKDGTLNKTNTVVRAVEENAHNGATVLGMLEGGGYSSKAAGMVVDYVNYKLHPEGNHLAQIKMPGQ